MLNVIILSVVMLNVVMLSVVMPVWECIAKVNSSLLMANVANLNDSICRILVNIS